jgi:hypothetical protein
LQLAGATMFVIACLWLKENLEIAFCSSEQSWRRRNRERSGAVQIVARCVPPQWP